MTCVPWVTSIEPSLRVFGGSSGTPTCAAYASTAATLLRRPMNGRGRPWSKLASHLLMTAGVSRAGSLVMKTTCTFSLTAAGSDRSALPRSAIVVGHSSGQFVYPKKTRVSTPFDWFARS